MQQLYALDSWIVGQPFQIEAYADVEVPLRHVVGVDQHFADLVGVIRIFALFCAVVLEQELTIAALYERRRMDLDLVDNAQDLCDLGAECRWCAVEDVPTQGTSKKRFRDVLPVGATFKAAAPPPA